MARKLSSRVVVNRKALSAIREGAVAGLEQLAIDTLAAAAPNVPDDDPIGVGLVTTGSYGVWADGKKVAGLGQKPRREKVKTGVTLIVGYDFPARFNEGGTIHQPARPFLTPAMVKEVPGADKTLGVQVRRRLARLGRG